MCQVFFCVVWRMSLIISELPENRHQLWYPFPVFILLVLSESFLV